MAYKDRQKQLEAQRKSYQKHKARIAAERQLERQADPEGYRNRNNRASRTRRQALAEYKLAKGCAICSYRGHPEALEFDHLPGADKKGQVSAMYMKPWPEVLREIEKCQVLCANCHAIITAERRREARQARKREQAENQLRLRLA